MRERGCDKCNAERMFAVAEISAVLAKMGFASVAVRAVWATPRCPLLNFTT